MAVSPMTENILFQLRSLMVRRGDLPSMETDPAGGLTNGDLLKKLKKTTEALDSKDDSKDTSGAVEDGR